ncbi:MAG: AHH domain-containing protein [Rhizobium sp.]|nr:AHH domain-containing protein [Rhizobium sp.]
MSGFQWHHLLPAQVYVSFRGYLDSLGHKHNSLDNLADLPSSLVDAFDLGRARHAGSHPAYSGATEKLARSIANAVDVGNLDLAKQHYNMVQSYLRTGLTTVFEDVSGARRPGLLLNGADALRYGIPSLKYFYSGFGLQFVEQKVYPGTVAALELLGKKGISAVVAGALVTPLTAAGFILEPTDVAAAEIPADPTTEEGRRKKALQTFWPDLNQPYITKVNVPFIGLTTISKVANPDFVYSGMLDALFHKPGDYRGWNTPAEAGPGPGVLAVRPTQEVTPRQAIDLQRMADISRISSPTFTVAAPPIFQPDQVADFGTIIASLRPQTQPDYSHLQSFAARPNSPSVPGFSYAADERAASASRTNTANSSLSTTSRLTGGLSPTERDERNAASRAAAASRGVTSATQSYAGQERYSSSSSSKTTSRRETRQPILFDLDNNGFALTTLDDSAFFFDIGGDGYKHRTAWVGAGDGVLVVDADGDGKISSRKEVVLTDWDPSADSDMEALRQVFDTNHNGLLDAGDAQWSLFKIAVTKPDGTTEMKTLAQLGIQSLTLVADETRYEYADGSSIDGEAVFTRTDGTQGKAATATLAIDASGFAVTETQATNAANERVITTKALAADGSVASESVRTTSADGKTITTRFDNDGDGVVDRILSDVTIDLTGGAKQRTETSRTGAGVLMATTVTTTNADRSLIQIDRDQLGGGYVTESETQQRGAGNSLVITVADKAASGAVISSIQTEFSGDRLTRTDRMDADGNLAYERALTSQTIHNAGGSLSKRDSVNAGDGTLLSRTVTEISANGLVRSETVDSDGDLAVDRNSSSVTTRNATTGASQIVEQVKARDLSLVTASTTTVSADGLSKTIASDIDGNGTDDRTSSDVTVIAADQSRTQTVEVRSGNGTLLSRAVTTRAVDGLTGSKTVDADGDGVVDQTATVVRNAAGQAIETSTRFSANGVMLSRSVATTSADGLSTTRQVDSFGLGSFDAVTTDVVVRYADGSAQQTLERLSGNNTLLEKTIASKSADGLLIQTQHDVTGDGVADTRGRDQTMVNADGSQVRTVETRSGDNSRLLSKEVITTSGNRRLIVRTVDADGDGYMNLRQTSTIATDGAKAMVEEVLTDSGNQASITTTTTSANGLSETVAKDVNGDGFFDTKSISNTVLALDGSKTVTTSNTSRNNMLLLEEVVIQSGNGFEIKTTKNLDGIPGTDVSILKKTVLNADGSSTTTVTQTAGTTTTSIGVTRVSANGLSTIIETNADGVGAIDLREVTLNQTAVDGSVTKIQEVTSENGSLISKQTVVTRSDGKNSTSTVSRGTPSNIVLAQVVAVQPDGSVYNTITETHNGTTSKMVLVDRKTAYGLLTVQSIDDNNDGSIERSRVSEQMILTDGSKKVVLSEYEGATKLLSTEETTTSGNGQKSTTVWKDGDGGQIRWHEKLNTIAQDGSSTVIETYRRANNSLESQNILTRSADGNTTVLIRDTDGDGVRNDYISETLGNDGVKTVQSQKLVPAGTVGAAIKTERTSANGLAVTTDFDRDGDGQSEVKLTSVTTLLDDGRTHTASTREDLLSNGTWQVSRDWKTVSGNGLVKTAQWEDVGAGYNLSRNQTTVFLANGARKTNDVIKDNTTIVRQTETTVSANGLRVDTLRDSDGVGGYDQVAWGLTTLLADGRTHTTDEFRSGTNLLLSRATTISADETVSVVSESSYVTGWTARTTTTDNRTRADGSKVVTALVTNYGGTQKREQTVVTTSADGRVTTTQHDINGDNINDQTRVQTLHADGRLWVVERTQAGDKLLSQVAISTTANGLQTVTETDWNGDTVNDLRKTMTKEIYGDGSSRTSTVLVNMRTNSNKSVTQETVSADGQRRLETTDLDGDGLADQTVSEERFISGIRKITVINNGTARASSEIRPGELYWKEKIPYRVETTVSLDGVKRSVRFDNDGDGSFELEAYSVTQLDGSIVTLLTESGQDGIIATGTMHQSHDQRVTILSADTQNDGVIDQVSSTTVSLDGSVKKVQTKLDLAGNLIENKITHIEATGHVMRSETWDSGDSVIETFVREADLSATRTRYDVATGFITSIDKLTDDEQLKSTTYYENGLLKSTSIYDIDKTNTWYRFDQYFDAAGNYTGYQINNDDGTRTVGWIDAANSETWKQYAVNYATNGAVYYAHKVFDDLNYEITSIDIYNVSDSAWNVDRFNASGVLLGCRQLFDSDAYHVTAFASNGGMSTKQIWGPGGIDYTYIEGDPFNAHAYNRIEYLHYYDQLYSITTYWDQGNVTTQLVQNNGANSLVARGDGAPDAIDPVFPNDSRLAIALESGGSAGLDGSVDETGKLLFARWSENATTDAFTNMQALRLVLDTNHDNVLDSSDARWDEFRIWQDLNQNGIAEAGELHAMPDAGVSLSNLMPSPNGALAFSDGSYLVAPSNYDLADASRHLTADASFRHVPVGSIAA